MNVNGVVSLIGRASDCESEKRGFNPLPSPHLQANKKEHSTACLNAEGIANLLTQAILLALQFNFQRNAEFVVLEKLKNLPANNRGGDSSRKSNKPI